MKKSILFIYALFFASSMMLQSQIIKQALLKDYDTQNYNPENYILICPDASGFVAKYSNTNGHFVQANDAHYNQMYMESVDNKIQVGENASFIYRFRQNNQEYIQTKDKKLGPFFSVEPPVISKNGSTYGFSCVLDKGDGTRFYVFINDKEYGPFPRKPVDISISNNGAAFGFGYLIEKDVYTMECCYNINGKPVGPFSKPAKRAYLPRFIEDGSKYITCIERSPDDFKVESYVQMNGKDIGPYDDIVDFRYTDKEGSAYYYIYKNPDTDNNGRLYINVNGNKLGPYSEIHTPSLSKDGSKIIFKYVSTSSSDQFIYNNGENLNPGWHLGQPGMSPDGSKYGFYYQSNDGLFMKINDKTYELPGNAEYIGAPKFSEDGKSYAYSYISEYKAYLNINGKVLGPYDKVDFIFINNVLYAAYIKDGTAYLEKSPK